MLEWYEWIFITIIALLVLLFLEGLTENIIKYLHARGKSKGE